jgi:hypothetical protein
LINPGIRVVAEGGGGLAWRGVAQWWYAARREVKKVGEERGSGELIWRAATGGLGLDWA